jgi:hypothetical protein
MKLTSRAFSSAGETPASTFLIALRKNSCGCAFAHAQWLARAGTASGSTSRTMHTWKWSKSSALRPSKMVLRCGASGLSRKNSSQKPSDFSTSSSSYGLAHTHELLASSSSSSRSEEGGRIRRYLEERFVEAHDLGLEGLRAGLLGQRRGFHGRQSCRGFSRIAPNWQLSRTSRDGENKKSRWRLGRVGGRLIFGAGPAMAMMHLSYLTPFKHFTECDRTTTTKQHCMHFKTYYYCYSM